jgi:hypothetical protein
MTLKTCKAVLMRGRTTKGIGRWNADQAEGAIRSLMVLIMALFGPSAHKLWKPDLRHSYLRAMAGVLVARPDIASSRFVNVQTGETHPVVWRSRNSIDQRMSGGL